MRRIRTWMPGLVAAALLLAAEPADAMFTNLERALGLSPMTSAAKSVTATCPAGKKLISAGADVTPGNGHVLIDDIRPDATLQRVTARAVEDETGTEDTWYVAAYALCAPAPAGLVRVSATSASTSAGKSATATCPSGKKVLGAGGETNGADGQLLLDGIKPTLDLKSVVTNALEDQTQTAANWTVTAYAICATAPIHGLQRVSATSSNDSSTSKVVAAVCPPDKQRIGMGGEINSASGQVVLDALYPDIGELASGFGAWEDDTGNSSGWSITSYAICASHALRAEWSSPSDAYAKTATASCPLATQLSGTGGELTSGFGMAWLRSLRMPTSSGTGTTAVADGINGASPWSVTAYALCTSILTSREIVPASTTASGRSDSATATCPAGKRAIGGAATIFYNDNYDDEILLQGVTPSADLTSVTVAGAEAPGANATWGLTGHAICATPPPGLQLVRSTSRSDSDEFKTAIATCPAGKHLTGAGGSLTPPDGDVILDDLRPNATLSGVTVSGVEYRSPPTGDDWSVSAYAICINR